MKVIFLKDHLQYKENQVAEVSDNRGNYFVCTRVAKEYSEAKKDIKPKNERKHKSKKK